MSRASILPLAALGLSIAIATSDMAASRARAEVAFEYTESRRHDDVVAMETFRPGYSFWKHIFTIPDGFIAFGSAVDGRLLAVFPAAGDWTRQADWKDAAPST